MTSLQKYFGVQNLNVGVKQLTTTWNLHPTNLTQSFENFPDSFFNPPTSFPFPFFFSFLPFFFSFPCFSFLLSFSLECYKDCPIRYTLEKMKLHIFMHILNELESSQICTLKVQAYSLCLVHNPDAFRIWKWYLIWPETYGNVVFVGLFKHRNLDILS